MEALTSPALLSQPPPRTAGRGGRKAKDTRDAKDTKDEQRPFSCP
jgi:hypothetical protein